MEWNTGMDYWTDIFLVLHLLKCGFTVTCDIISALSGE